MAYYGANKVTRSENIRAALVAAIVVLAGAMTILSFSEADSIRIFMIGDSTMSNKPDPEHNPEVGWGQVLPRFFDDAVSIHNHAVNGRSTKSFIDEGRWDAVHDSLAAGDYLVIQFAHNDQKDYDPRRYTNPYTGYRNNLVRFIRESREKGAVPILVSPVVRRNFNDNGTLVDTHGSYPFVMREVATEFDVPFVDLQSMSESLVNEMGVDDSRELYMWVAPGEYERYPDGKEDNTHFREKGALAMARMFAESLGEIGLDELVKHVVLQN
jgi:lysophospholipase L1-like esterase